jgi:hypothetical protein
VLLALAAALSAAVPVGRAAEDGTARPAPSPIWGRVVVLGASASAGYGTARGLGDDVSLARVVDRMILREHEPVVDASTYQFFAAPRMWARNKTALARKAKPTMVIALDFLFWFGYGAKERESDRMRDLEEGFAFLEGFDCPVLVSLLPDMSRSVGKMLFANQVPSPERIRELNARIREWAESHDNVIVVPVVDFLDEIRSGKAVEVGSAAWPARATYLLIQSDDLHPTVEGLAALAHLALHTATSRIPGVSSEAFDLGDPLALGTRLREQASVTGSEDRR